MKSVLKRSLFCASLAFGVANSDLKFQSNQKYQFKHQCHAFWNSTPRGEFDGFNLKETSKETLAQPSMDSNLRATVVVQGYNKRGKYRMTGILTPYDRQVLVNYSSIKDVGQEHLLVYLWDGRQYIARAKHISKEFDIAMLEIYGKIDPEYEIDEDEYTAIEEERKAKVRKLHITDMTPIELQSLPFMSLDDDHTSYANVGDHVVGLCNYLYYKFNIVYGHVDLPDFDYLKKEGEGQDFSQLRTFPVAMEPRMGHRGGPLFNHEGKLLGVFQYGNSVKSRSYFLSIRDVRTLIESDSFDRPKLGFTFEATTEGLEIVSKESKNGKLSTNTALQVGDIVVSCEGGAVLKSVDQLDRAIGLDIAQPLLLLIKRKETGQFAEVVV